MLFPSEKSLAAWESHGEIDEVLGLYANAILSIDKKECGQFIRKYIDRHPPLQNAKLRKAVFHRIFHEHVLKDSTIEVYWQVAELFGPLNESICIEYLASAPRNIALKLGRLLLYKVEFANEALRFETLENFEQIVLLFFSVNRILEATVTPEFIQELTRLARSTRGASSKAANRLLDLANSMSDASQIRNLFPQLSLPQTLFLLRELNSANAVSVMMLDEPQKVLEMLQNPAGVASKPGTYVVLDKTEKDKRLERLRDFNRQNFKYEYTAMEDEDQDEDPDEGDRAVDDEAREELSQADKKLAALEDQLWSYWQTNRSLFDTGARKTKERDAMRTKLGWTNEQIEGWGKIVGRRGKAQSDFSSEVETYAPKRADLDGKSEKPKSNEPAMKRKSDRPPPKPGKSGNRKPKGNSDSKSHAPKKIGKNLN